MRSRKRERTGEHTPDEGPKKFRRFVRNRIEKLEMFEVQVVEVQVSPC